MMLVAIEAMTRRLKEPAAREGGREGGVCDVERKNPPRGALGPPTAGPPGQPLTQYRENARRQARRRRELGAAEERGRRLVGRHHLPRGAEGGRTRGGEGEKSGQQHSHEWRYVPKRNK